MEKQTIEAIAALKLELAALEAQEAKIKNALYLTAAGAMMAVTFYLVGLF
jgi:hypothetical protein